MREPGTAVLARLHRPSALLQPTRRPSAPPIRAPAAPPAVLYRRRLWYTAAGCGTPPPAVPDLHHLLFSGIMRP
jgi:hypothetical protein